MENFKKFYIDGQWVDPQSSTTFPFINPATEEEISVSQWVEKKMWISQSLRQKKRLSLSL